MNWQEHLELSRDVLEEMRTMGYLYVRQGSYDIALTIFNALTLLSPNTPYDQQTLGALYLQKGDPLRSLEHLDKALSLEPEHLLTQLNRAKALLSLGYKKQALTAAQALLGCRNPEIALAAASLIEGNR